LAINIALEGNSDQTKCCGLASTFLTDTPALFLLSKFDGFEILHCFVGNFPAATVLRQIQNRRFFNNRKERVSMLAAHLCPTRFSSTTLHLV